MATTPGAVEHGDDEHELLRLTDFINDAIGEAPGETPAHLPEPAATGVQVRRLPGVGKAPRRRCSSFALFAAKPPATEGESQGGVRRWVGPASKMHF